MRISVATRIMVVKLIKTYQKLSPAVIPRVCRFHPSCSQYAIEAVERWGLGHGLFKALKRILKCSPLFRGGHDPVI